MKLATPPAFLQALYSSRLRPGRASVMGFIDLPAVQRLASATSHASFATNCGASEILIAQDPRIVRGHV